MTNNNLPPVLNPETFDFTPEERENQYFALRSDVRCIGVGSEHIVYYTPTDDPEATNVMKVNHRIMAAQYRLFGEAVLNQSTRRVDSLPTGHLLPEGYMKSLKARHRRLVDVFGEDHFLLSQKYGTLAIVPARAFELLIGEKLLWRSQGFQPVEGNLLTPHTIVHHQEYSPYLNDKKTDYLAIGYCERDNPFLTYKNHERASERYVLNRDDGPYDSELLTDVQGGVFLRRLVERCDKGDDGLQKLLADITRKAILYSNASREPLDLSMRNLAFYQDPGGEWRSILSDVLYPTQTPLFDEAAEALIVIDRQLPGLDRPKLLSLLNTLGYIRTINGLAERFDIDERIELFPVPMKFRDTLWREVLTLLRHKVPLASTTRSGLETQAQRVMAISDIEGEEFSPPWSFLKDSNMNPHAAVINILGRYSIDGS